MKRVSAALPLLLSLFNTGAMAAEPPMDKARVEQIVHEYLLTHPEVLLEMSTALKAKQDQQVQSSRSDAISAAADELYRNTADPAFGPAKSKLTLVEFYDYNCGYCKTTRGMISALHQANPGLRIAMKPYPILSDGSVVAAQAALVTQKLHPEKFPALHEALLGYQGKLDSEAAIAGVTASVGLDWNEIRQHLNDKDIDAYLRQVHALASQLNITGTPAFVVGDQYLGGAPRTPDALVELIKSANPL